MYSCQPIDVGVNRPINGAMSEQLEGWLDNERLENGVDIKALPQELIAT